MMRNNSVRALGLIAVLLLVVLAASMWRSGRALESARDKRCLAITSGNPPTVAYYVSAEGRDSGDGSTARPWATLQRAAQTVKAGAIVHVATGTYIGSVKTTTSGTPGARIIFLSDVRGGARIIAPGSYTAWENDGDNIDIEGFDITGDGNIGLLNLGSRVRIIGNHVHDIPAKCSSDGGSGINNGNYAAHDNDTIANVVHNIGDVNVPCPRVHGIYHANVRGHVWNNITYNNQGYGIHLWHTPVDVVVANNLVFHNGQGGITVGAGDAPGGVSADGMVVTNNIVIDNGTWGAGWGIVESGRIGTHNLYSNNLVWGNRRDVALEAGRDIATVNSDPRLVHYVSDGTGVYRLSAASPALAAGNRTGAPPIDFDGRARPADQPPDIGPYQFSSASPAWPLPY